MDLSPYQALSLNGKRELIADAIKNQPSWDFMIKKSLTPCLQNQITIEILKCINGPMARAASCCTKQF